MRLRFVLAACALLTCADISVASVEKPLPVFFEPAGASSGGAGAFLVRRSEWVAVLHGTYIEIALASGAYRLMWAGAGQNAQLRGRERTSGTSNYLIGHNAAWRSGVAQFARAEATELYPGIDIVYYGTQGRLEYDLRIHPGADPKKIRMRLKGTEEMRVTPEGDLSFRVGGTEVKYRRPRAFQQAGDQRIPVEVSYRIGPGKLIGFQTGSYDRTLPLVIDPVLTLSTYLGGSGNDYVSGLAVDEAGYMYMAGYTLSPDLPVKNAFQAVKAPKRDVFVAKVNPTTGEIVYATYLGGADDDLAYGIAVDSSGCAYVTGATASPDFPRVNAYQSAFHGAGQVFVAKLNAAGNALVYSTYLGGGDDQAGSAIAVDAAGNAYVAGMTRSPDFPTRNAYQSCPANQDAFFSKLDASGSSLLFSSCLGGSGADRANSIALDTAENIYLTGETNSIDFPVLQTVEGAPAFYHPDLSRAFVSKFQSEGSTLLYSTCLGADRSGDGGESHGLGIVADAAGNAYVTGWTNDDSFPLRKPIQSVPVRSDCFLTKLSGGGALVFSTFLGSSSDDFCTAIALDPQGRVLVAGNTGAGSDLPLVDPIAALTPTRDTGFVAMLDSDAPSILFSSYLGSPDAASYLSAIAPDRSGNVYVAGQVDGTGFSVGPVQTRPKRASHAAEDSNRSAVDVLGGRIQLASACTYEVSDPEPLPAAGGYGSVKVTAPDGCIWNAVSRSALLIMAPNNIVYGGGPMGYGEYQGSGTDTVVYFADYASGPDRNLEFVVAGKRVEVKQYGYGCSYSLSSLQTMIPASGGSGSFSVTTNSGCPHSASTAESWINILTATGVSGGIVDFQVAANTTGSPRQGTISVNGLVHTVSQDPQTSYSGPLSVHSVSPTYTAGPVTWNAVVSDTSGYADIDAVELLINSSASVSGGCYVRYELSQPPALRNDDNTAWLSGAYQENSRCILVAAGSSWWGSGNDLYVSIAAYPKETGTAVSSNVYLKAVSKTGSVLDFQKVAAWSTTVGTPSVLSVTPPGGLITSESIQVHVSDTGGPDDLKTVELLIGDSPASGCYAQYDDTISQFRLRNDAATGWLSGTTQENSRCILNASASTLVSSGFNLTVSINLTFKQGFSGQKNVYGKAVSYGGAVADFKQVATWTVVPLGPRIASPLSVTPASGTGSSRIFHVLVSDAAGFADVSSVEFLLNSTAAGPGGCAVRYDAASNSFHLADDSYTVWLSGSMQQNSQCSLSTAGSWASGRGSNLLLTYSLSFNPVFAGARDVYVKAASSSGTVTDFQKLATWNVVAPGLGIPSIPPENWSGGGAQSLTTVQVKVSDTAGYSDLGTVEFLVNSTVTGPGSCSVRYDRPGNQFHLATDDYTQWLSGDQQENSQCALNAAASWASGVGQELTLSFSLLFKQVFAGTRYGYLKAITNQNQVAGFTEVRNWIIGAPWFPGPVKLTGPADGVVDTPSVLAWSAASGATSYSVRLGTTNPPPFLEQVSGNSLAVPNLQPNTTYYWSVSALNDAGGGWSSPVWSFTTTTFSKATISAPAPGSPLAGSTVTFAWSGIAGATAYWLDVGTVQGQGNIFGQNVGLATSQAVTGIPTNGGSIYVRLWTQLSGVWQCNDYRFTAANIVAKAALFSPSPGTTLAGSTVTFTWGAASGASAYWLDVGTVQGQGNIFGQNVDLLTSQTVTGIPTNGGPIYVRLWTQTNGVWISNDYAYTAFGKAAISTPAAGTTLAGSSVTFTWSAASSASAYWLDVGTVQGQGNIFGQNVGWQTSQYVTGIPTDGSPIYVRLWTQSGGVWTYNDYTYTASGKAAMSSPAAGSVLSSAAMFTWSTVSGATAYWLDVGTMQGQGNIFGKNVGLLTSQYVTGIPTNGSPIYVRLWTQIGGAWTCNDYTYTASGKAAMSSPAPGSVLGSAATFTWTAASGAAAYWLDVGTVQGQGNIFGQNVGLLTSQSVAGIPTNGATIYVRLWTQSGGAWTYNDYTYTASGWAAISSPAAGSVLSGSAVTFGWTVASGATAYWLDVGTVQGQGNIFGQNVGVATSQNVTGIPTNGGLIYVRLWTQLAGNWLYNDYVYTAPGTTN